MNRGYHNIDKPFIVGGPYVGYGAGTFLIRKNSYKGSPRAWRGVEKRTGVVIYGPTLEDLSRQLEERALAAANKAPAVK